MTIEFRQMDPDATEIRSVGDGMAFTGYVSRYGMPSLPLPFIETVEPGAWSKSLKSRNDIKSFVNHNTDMVLGSTRAGTLRFTDDERGLLTNIDLPETTYGRDLSVSVARGDVSGMSVGMSVVRDEWSDGGAKRRIIEARLHEASVVTGFQAFTSTTAAVRSLPLIAHRCNEDADLLEIAFDALLMAQTLDTSTATLLRSVIDTLADDPQDADALAEVDEARVPMSLLGMKLDLLAKSLAL
jgi:hypothetical protein